MAPTLQRQEAFPQTQYQGRSSFASETGDNSRREIPLTQYVRLCEFGLFSWSPWKGKRAHSFYVARSVVLSLRILVFSSRRGMIWSSQHSGCCCPTVLHKASVNNLRWTILFSVRSQVLRSYVSFTCVRRRRHYMVFARMCSAAMRILRNSRSSNDSMWLRPCARSAPHVIEQKVRRRSYA